MKKFLLCTLLLALYPLLLMAQSPDTLWTKTYGGPNLDEGYSVQQTSDGGYIISGYTRSFGAGQLDVYLIKTDADGNILWTKAYGEEYWDLGYSVRETSDGGYIIAGETWPFGFGVNSYFADVYLIKTDSSGDTLWTKIFGDTTYYEAGYSVQETSDGGYIIAGFIEAIPGGNEDVYVIKTDANGDTLWTKTYGGLNGEAGYSIQQTSDYGYIIVGSTMSFWYGNGDICLIKTNLYGDMLWIKALGDSGPYAGEEWGYSVQQTPDHGYIIAGSNGDALLIKTDNRGNSLWAKTYGYGEYNYWWDEARSVQQTADGGYIIAGYTEVDTLYASNSDVYLVKTDANGDTLWTKVIGGPKQDRAYSIQQTSDYGYIIVGSTMSFGAGSYDVYLVKIAPDTFGIQENLIANPSLMELKISPNPVYKKCNIEYSLPQKSKVNLSLFDVTGRLVKEIINEKQNAGKYSRVFDMTDLSQDVYFIRLNTNEHTEVKKVIFIK